jgi:hypothetical protein
MPTEAISNWRSQSSGKIRNPTGGVGSAYDRRERILPLRIAPSVLHPNIGGPNRRRSGTSDPVSPFAAIPCVPCLSFCYADRICFKYSAGLPFFEVRSARRPRRHAAR